MSATLAKSAGAEIMVKQFPSLVKRICSFRAWQATYSWPLSITFKSRGTLETLKQFLAHTTTPKGWPVLMSVDNLPKPIHAYPRNGVDPSPGAA